MKTGLVFSVNCSEFSIYVIDLSEKTNLHLQKYKFSK